MEIDSDLFCEKNRNYGVHEFDYWDNSTYKYSVYHPDRTLLDERKSDEAFMKEIYESRGWDVKKIEANSTLAEPEPIRNYILDEICRSRKEFREEFMTAGIPDFLVYNDTEKPDLSDFFFLETKRTRTATMARTQIQWTAQWCSRVPIRIAVVMYQKGREELRERILKTKATEVHVSSFGGNITRKEYRWNKKDFNQIFEEEIESLPFASKERIEFQPGRYVEKWIFDIPPCEFERGEKNVRGEPT
ncbi:hypothetical protein [Halomontanus rarus]|uniref:hypothetical protein n=1 Tax=Halomontanus rarus TaxID=3034020 RepID=UPI001A99EB6B